MAKKSRFLQHDKTEKMFTSPRQEGTYLYITSKGDDIANNIRGKGSSLIIDNTIDKSSTKIIETQFIDNIFMKDGIIFWENAVLGDTISLELVLPANVPFLSETTTGNAVIIDGVPTYITTSQIPDQTWTGTHIYFPMDVVLFRFVNEFCLIGTNYTGLTLESSDTAEIPKEFKIRLLLNSSTSSDIKVIVNIETYRYRTI
jgi:hypothetical protein